jgi:hypothetical protein
MRKHYSSPNAEWLSFSLRDAVSIEDPALPKGAIGLDDSAPDIGGGGVWHGVGEGEGGN